MTLLVSNEDGPQIYANLHSYLKLMRFSITVREESREQC